MVSTRKHPMEFPAPELSPTKSKSRTSTASPAPSSPDVNSSPTSKSLAKRAVSNSAAFANSVAENETSSQGTWSHCASNITLAWLAISFPLVLWDCLYIMLRPHTMAGGAIQWPIWKPYEIYAEIDHVYGWPGWEGDDGFSGAQGFMNGIELVLYGLYGAIVWNHGIQVESGKGWLSGGVKVEGKLGNRALLIGFSAALMTFSKTVLYYLSEFYSGFHNTKHNDWPTLIAFYVIMNGCWIVFPAYMTAAMGSEIIAGLDVATESSAKKKN